MFYSPFSDMFSTVVNFTKLSNSTNLNYHDSISLVDENLLKSYKCTVVNHLKNSK